MVAGWRKRRGSSSFMATVIAPLSASRRVYPGGVPAAGINPAARLINPAARLRGLFLGCKNLLEPFIAGQLAVLGGRFLNQFLDDRVGGDAFRGRGEVSENAMPQHRIGQCLNILCLDMDAAMQQSAGLAAENEILHGPRTSAPG